MSTVGGLPFVQGNSIIWYVSRCDLPLEESLRVWSLEFQFRNKTISGTHPPYKNVEVPEGWIGLICVNTYNYEYRDNLCYRFGFINTINSFTNTCDGEWIEEKGVKGYFKVPKFCSKEWLTLKGQRQVHRLQLFCEVVTKQNRKVENPFEVFLSTTISIPNDGSTGNSNSSSCKERNLEELQNEGNQSKSPFPLTSNTSEAKSVIQEDNWNCAFCTYTNAAKRSKCKLCHIDKTVEDKYQVTTQTPVKATKNKERKDTHSRKSSHKSDDVLYVGIKNPSCRKAPQVLPVTDTVTRADEGKERDIRSEICNKKSDEIKSQDFKNLEKLSQNFKDLYIKGKDTDLTITVKFREFKAHKVILRARSSIFDAMFSHDMSESKTGVLPIEDCEPAVFEEFLFFIYGGRINLSCDNACEMYYLADKYDMPELKEECIHFLKKSLSTETICDAICLSTKYNEKELLNIATDFFAKNMEEILVTVKWQLFLKENPTEANELTIQALKLGFTKRKF